MPRILVCLTLMACSPTPINGDCDPAQCATRQCANGRCIDVIDGGTISVDTGFDSSTTDSGPMLPDGGPGGCLLPCSDNESCFSGRCVLCDGDQQVEGCACTGPETCRTGSCSGGVCQTCTRTADCATGEGSTAICDDGICSTCGGPDEACCLDPMSGMETMCDAMAGMCTVSGRCGVCGAVGQPCCAIDGCATGACNIMGVCELCGGPFQPPCEGGICAAFHMVMGEICVPCGQNRGVCCPPPQRCRNGNCNGTTCQRDDGGR